MHMTFKVSKNRHNNSVSNLVNYSMSARVTKIVKPVQPTIQLVISSYKHMKILNIFEGFYDSLPTVNTDSSLPISFDGITSSFPNTRYSFFKYESNSPLKGDNKYYEDSYYNELESNPFPYGYEHEECFSKHSQTYGRGTSLHYHITETNKVIKLVRRKIIIGYVKKSNTYIVQSKFLKEDDSVSVSFTFFKQNQKLMYKKQDYISWNSSVTLPSCFSDKIKNYLKENNTLLYEAINSSPETVCQYRTVLNNPFWRKTSATYLLNIENKKLRRRAQDSFKRNKYKDPILEYNLPKLLENLIRESTVSYKNIPDILKIYEELIKHLPVEEVSKQIYNLLKLEQINYGVSNYSLILKFLDKLIQLNFVNFEASFAKPLKCLITFFYDHPMVSLVGCTSVSEYLEKLVSSLFKKSSNVRSQFTINNKVVVINPTVSEMIRSHIETNFQYFSSITVHNLHNIPAIYNGRPINHNITSIANHITLHELLSNSDILVANNIIDKLEYKKREIESLILDDIF